MATNRSNDSDKGEVYMATNKKMENHILVKHHYLWV